MQFIQGKELTEFIESQNEIKKQVDDYIIKFNEISFNISYEEISEEGLSKIKAASKGKPTEYLQEKIINLHKQINKDRATIKNQKEELYKLNLKLQKCISLEEHDLKMKTVLNEKHKLEAENIEMGKLVNLNKSALDLAVMTKELAMKTVEEQNKKIEQLKAENKSLKESSKISCNMLHSQKDTIVSLRDDVINKVDNMRDIKNKEIENLKAVIEYLESKAK